MKGEGLREKGRIADSEVLKLLSADFQKPKSKVESRKPAGAEPSTIDLAINNHQSTILPRLLIPRPAALHPINNQQLTISN
jgi:hypothetical protein